MSSPITTSAAAGALMPFFASAAAAGWPARHPGRRLLDQQEQAAERAVKRTSAIC
jgi:hypothetical protein